MNNMIPVINICGVIIGYNYDMKIIRNSYKVNKFGKELTKYLTNIEYRIMVHNKK